MNYIKAVLVWNNAMQIEERTIFLSYHVSSAEHSGVCIKYINSVCKGSVLGLQKERFVARRLREQGCDDT